MAKKEKKSKPKKKQEPKPTGPVLTPFDEGDSTDINESCDRFLKNFKEGKQFKVGENSDSDEAVLRVAQALSIKKSPSQDEIFDLVTRLPSKKEITWVKTSMILGNFHHKERLLKLSMKSGEVKERYHFGLFGYFKMKKLRKIIGKQAFLEAQQKLGKINFDSNVATFPTSEKPPVVKPQ